MDDGDAKKFGVDYRNQWGLEIETFVLVSAYLLFL